MSEAPGSRTGCKDVEWLAQEMRARLDVTAAELEAVAAERRALTSVLENYAEAGRQLLSLKELLERVLNEELANKDAIRRHALRLERVEAEVALMRLRGT